MRVKWTLFLVLAALVAVLVACGGGQPTPAPEVAETVVVTVEQKEVEAPKEEPSATPEAQQEAEAPAEEPAIAAAVELPAVDPLAVSGDIVTAGSSTVFPFEREPADQGL